ncbi:MAG: endonuclease III [Clostridia bacterium]|nr:endonuclease III [Clostridia bacterium]
MAESGTAKKLRAGAIVARLEEVYPEAACALRYEGEPWKLMVMGRLSAQCTDLRVNEVCAVLFKVFPTARDLADGELNKIEEIVRPCGLFRTKAKDIKAECALLCGKYGGELPRDMETLLTFPGVGRKIANLLLGDIHGQPAIVADTHCIRLSRRMGLTPEGETDPVRTEKALRELIPPEKSNDFCHRLVMFGREYCPARSPDCGVCPVADLCMKRV